jgi:hypothetical protein
MLDKINLIFWKDISKYNDKGSSTKTFLLKCPVNGIYEGWFNDTGWEAVSSAEFMGPIEPQPLYFCEV